MGINANPGKRLRVGTILAFALLVVSATAPAGVIFGFAPNGVAMNTRVDVGFKGDGLVAADFADDTDFQVVPDTMLVTTALASATKLPATGDVKDIATGSLKFEFEHGLGFPGASLPVDLLRIGIDGTASALAAMNLAGNPANAQVSATGSALFFLDAGFGGIAIGDVAGQLEIGAIRSLLPYESVLEIVVSENGIPIVSLPAGSGATAVELRGHREYSIAFNYDIEVPFGIDPPFSFALDIPFVPATAVPEPATALLAALGMLGIVRDRRRRKPA